MADAMKPGDAAVAAGWSSADPATLYPAVVHFRIIVEAGFAGEAALHGVLAGYDVTAPLAASRSSQQGRFRAFGVSVRVGGREELVRLDQALRAVEGVRLLL